MHPLIDLTLGQPKQLPVIDLGRVLFEITQDKEQPIFRRGEGTMRIGRVAAILAPFALQRPFHHMGLKRRFKRCEQPLKFARRETGQGQYLRSLVGNLRIRQSSHLPPPHLVGAQYSTNRNNLYF